MAINAKQLRALIKETLTEARLTTNFDSAVELLMLTAAVESDLGTYIEQVKGPAQGIFQVEPATHDDIMKRWLSGRSREFQHRIYDFLMEHMGANLKADAMRYNLKYAVILARLKYMTIPEPIPAKNDIKALAGYWKKFYNTRLGAGTVEGAIKKYNKFCR